MQVNTDTRILGIIGYPLEHSLSPAMHNQALKSLGLNYIYVPFQVERGFLPGAVQGLRALGITGVNVTLPFKEAIVEYLDGLSEEARACRAVNVVINGPGGLLGYNTDGPGFIAALKEAGVRPADRKAVVLGAGGAARAIAYQLARGGAREITFINRTVDKARDLASFIYIETGVKTRATGWGDAGISEVIRRADILVNTTPIGMYPHTQEMPPVRPEWFHPDLVVSDIIYNPVKTRLLAEASQMGLKTVDGVGMFVYQGALSFKLFTGKTAPVKLMREVVTNQLQEKHR